MGEKELKLDETLKGWVRFLSHDSKVAIDGEKNWSCSSLPSDKGTEEVLVKYSEAVCYYSNSASRYKYLVPCFGVWSNSSESF